MMISTALSLPRKQVTFTHVSPSLRHRKVISLQLFITMAQVGHLPHEISSIDKSLSSWALYHCDTDRSLLHLFSITATQASHFYHYFFCHCDPYRSPLPSSFHHCDTDRSLLPLFFYHCDRDMSLLPPSFHHCDAGRSFSNWLSISAIQAGHFPHLLSITATHEGRFPNWIAKNQTIDWMRYLPSKQLTTDMSVPTW